MNGEHLLTLSCPDRPGIVHAVSTFLVVTGCNILDSQQYRDPDSERFFMRVHVAADPAVTVPSLRSGFEATATSFAMDWQLAPSDRPLPTIVLVSKQDHCLQDLLFRHRTGALPIDLRAVVSNHPDTRSLVEWHGIAFHHLPVAADTKADAEAQLLALVQAEQVELVVLARYMQVLSPDLCARLTGSAINIHHSFLPSFKGARPYAQAHDRGVKLIGASAHYVTAALDEGPIIEQDVARADHTHTAEALARVGQDIEARVLARAVLWHAERRVLLNGSRTVVFR
ncbi:MAG: formyltetrahydrofolate deformylase [Actinomycetota bacterium]|nr:formyltetrahydrofolate deformylase [Actinomycetota bacterium]